MRKSSILNAGRAKNSKHIEYLGKGGFMELKSNQLQKKILDYVLSEDEMDMPKEYLVETQWYFAEICNDALDIDFFEQEENLDIYDYRASLSWCANILNSSPTARLMLKEVSDKDWQVTLEDLNGGDYCIDVEQKLLILDNNALEASALAKSNYFRNTILITMIKALRDIWQEKRHGGFDEFYSPEHILLMERIRAADLDVIAVLVAWELRAEEYSEGWRHIIGSDIGDLAMSYSGYLERDPTARFNGQALVATFKQWFRSTLRVDDCDRDALEYMDEILGNSNLANPFGRKSPAKMNIEVLSCLPDRSAYLQGLGAEIMHDPMFSSVDNEINQTHLFHIMYDLEAVMVQNVPFRDAALARKIFPV